MGHCLGWLFSWQRLEWWFGFIPKDSCILTISYWYFACSTFIASQVLLYILKMDNIYWLRATASDRNSRILASIIEDPEAFFRRDSKVQRMEFSSVALTWTYIFAVKSCFLLFFHPMITRLRRLILAWTVIFGTTIIFWAFCTCAVSSVVPTLTHLPVSQLCPPNPHPILLLFDHST